jgi:short subunit dehydrogenase-like uncharacterized protein
MNKFLLYGSYGYSGNLIARQALERGLTPVLAGRDARKLKKQAEDLNLEYLPFSLDDHQVLVEHLRQFPVVLHAAGPFIHTGFQMAAACLQAGTHYLDITGEIAVLEKLAAMDQEARARSVMLLPAVGFDVVPTDCLAVFLKKQLPDASHLTIAFLGVGGGVSRGTAKSGVEHIHRGAMTRVDGELQSIEGIETREIDFGRGPRKSLLIPWGDNVTAWHSTGIPNIKAYSGSHGPLIPVYSLLGRLKGLTHSRMFKNVLKKSIDLFLSPGPSPERNLHGKTIFWAEVSNGSASRAARLTAPEGYRLTALTAVAIVEKVLQADYKPGFQTPARAYGPDLVLEIPGVVREFPL